MFVRLESKGWQRQSWKGAGCDPYSLRSDRWARRDPTLGWGVLAAEGNFDLIDRDWQSVASLYAGHLMVTNAEGPQMEMAKPLSENIYHYRRDVAGT
ncbi:MAG: hypothetical protein WBV25_03870 [Methylocella sp.]